MFELTKRQREIVCFLLLRNDYVTLDKLAEHFEVSKRTIQNDLVYINDLFNANNISLDRKPSFGIKLDINRKDEDKINSILNDLQIRILDKKERIDYIVVLLLCNEKLTYQEIADILRLSRQTVINSIEEVNSRLTELNINLNINKNKGLSISAKEIDIRKAFINYAFKCDCLDYVGDYSKASVLLEELKNQYNFDFTDLNKTLAITAYCINRVNNKHYIEEGNELIIFNDDYYKTINKYVNNNSEKIFLGNLLLNERVNNLTKLESFNYDKEAKEITDYLINSLIKDQNIEVPNDVENFKNGLIQHIHCALYRIRNNLSVKNELLDQVRYTMPVLYAFTSKKLKAIQDEYGVEFDDTETSFITMYLTTIYEINTQKRNVSALVVCSYGMASSSIIKNRLSARISGIDIYGPLNISEARKYLKEHDVDFVISTVDIDDIDKPLIVINPLLDNQDILLINNKIDELYFDRMCHQLINEDGLEKENIHYLGEYLSANDIQLIDEDISWREAIVLSAKPLYEKGLINKHYIDEMVSAVDKYGTYMVLSENTAYVHAGRDDGIKENCTALLVSKKKIDFGDSNTKQINNIFVLGIKDQSKTEIFNVVHILGKDENIKKLKEDVDKETILRMHD